VWGEVGGLIASYLVVEFSKKTLDDVAYGKIRWLTKLLIDRHSQDEVVMSFLKGEI